jgi:murein L,D-transpeptidase YcbB/YkuD
MIRNEGAHYIPPGQNNPLGQLLFELDNDQLIFLHDTNDRSLFGRSNRALSHGCVRVEQARPLAAWALGVSVREVEAMISSKATYSVPLSTPIQRPSTVAARRTLRWKATRWQFAILMRR